MSGFIIEISFVLLVYYLVLQYEDNVLSKFFTRNAIIQNILFVVVACIPALKTGKMMMVDVAWPWGLLFVAIQGFMYGSGNYTRKLLICICLGLQGGRMALGGFFIFKKKTDFPRYEYAKLMWKQAGIIDNRSIMLQDIMIQCFANIGILAFPMFIVCFQNSELQIFDYTCFLYFIFSFLFESKADMQKLNWAKANKGSSGFCNVGLWKYCRHPNYFGEWNCWNAYVIWTICCLNLEQDNLGQYRYYLSIVTVLLVTANMYYCLVIWTGAQPAEYFSEKKRKGYKEYQKTTNQFFPWFPKQIKNE